MTASAAPLEDGDGHRVRQALFESASFTKTPMNTPLPPLWWMETGAVEARLSLDSLPIVMRFSQEGYVLEYDGTCAPNGLSFTDTSYTRIAPRPD